VRSGRLVICYHAVSETWDHQLAVRPDALERQLGSAVRRGFRPVSAVDVIRARGRALHVTFDDAFHSVQRALPALERLGVRATVFACTAYATDGRRLEVGNLADVRSAPDAETATMRWDELRALADRGVEIGSHTDSHPRLTRLTDTEIDRELTVSKEAIEDELGRPCVALAYPFGDHDPRVQEAARRAGYEVAFTLDRGRRRFDRLAVPRVDVYRKDTQARFALKTSSVGPALTAAHRSASRARRPYR
jgi:peptidoglycan/xylan/chitin deacetylase (PgdA/CDA1 family)